MGKLIIQANKIKKSFKEQEVLKELILVFTRGK